MQNTTRLMTNLSLSTFAAACEDYNTYVPYESYETEINCSMFIHVSLAFEIHFKSENIYDCRTSLFVWIERKKILMINVEEFTPWFDLNRYHLFIFPSFSHRENSYPSEQQLTPNFLQI